jgi:hypothetical protein
MADECTIKLSIKLHADIDQMLSREAERLRPALELRREGKLDEAFDKLLSLSVEGFIMSKGITVIQENVETNAPDNVDQLG